jgi:hypothetical protein
MENEVLQSSIIRVIGLRRMKWTGHVARVVVMRNEYIASVGKSEEIVSENYA